MAFPADWPPRTGSGQKNIRVYSTGALTANFDDNAFHFSAVVGANPYTPLPVVLPGSSATVNVGPNPMGTGQNDLGSITPAIFSESLRITATGAAVEFSFDGINIHGVVAAGTTVAYDKRRESGIALRGVGATYVIEAW